MALRTEGRIFETKALLEKTDTERVTDSGGAIVAR